MCKDKFENLQNEKKKGQILRSKAKCYEQDEKSSKYFLNLEKKNGAQITINFLAEIQPNGQEKIIHSKEKIISSIKEFFSSLYKKKLDITTDQCKSMLENLSLKLMLSKTLY